MSLAAKPGQVVIFNEELPYIKLEEPFVRSRNKLTMQYLHYNSGYSYKLRRVVLYHEELSSIKSQNLLIPWSCKVTQQIKYIISLLARDLYP